MGLASEGRLRLERVGAGAARLREADSDAVGTQEPVGSVQDGRLRRCSVDPCAPSQRIQELYERRSELGKDLARLRQRKNPRNDLPISADNPTAEYRKLLNEYGMLDKELAAKRSLRGDKNVPRRGRPRLRRSSTSGGSSSGGFQIGDYGSGGGGSSGGSSSSGFTISKY